MKNFFVFLFVFFFAVSGAAASEFSFNSFAANIDQDNLKPFSKDLAGLLGAGSFTTGRILGWGGFQLSGHAAVMPKPSRENTALGARDDNDFKVFPWIQGEIGLPFRLDGFIRATSYDGLTVAGGGLKWGIIRPTEILYTFQPMVVIMAQSGVHKDFSLTHYSADMVVSWRLPYINPYLGGGVDYMKLTVEGADNPAVIGETAHTTTPRGVLGLNFRLPSYMNLSIAANYANYGVGAEASFGVRF